MVVQKCRSEDEARVKRLAEARKRREQEAREAAKRAAEERRAEEEERKRYAMWQTDVLTCYDLVVWWCAVLILTYVSCGGCGVLGWRRRRPRTRPTHDSRPRKNRSDRHT